MYFSTTSAPESTSRLRLLHSAWPIALCLLLALFLAGCESPPRVYQLGGQTMGTTWSVQANNLPQGLSQQQLHDRIEAILELINSQMSTYRDDADITRFNQAAPGESFSLAEDFATVLSAALSLAAETDGAYDPTVGPLVNLWGFGPDGLRDQAPDPAEIEAARQRVGWQRVAFDANSRELTQTGGVYLDLSSIAKGHAVDRIAEWLEDAGVTGYLVDIGGDLRVHGVKPDGSAWRIAIERPVPGTREIYSVIEPQDLAVASSGNYRNFFIDQDQLFSHTIDPRSGYPVRGGIASITVLHRSTKQADALATALGVFSADEAFAFALERNLAVLFLVHSEGSLEERATPAFERLTTKGTQS